MIHQRLVLTLQLDTLQSKRACCLDGSWKRQTACTPSVRTSHLTALKEASSQACHNPGFCGMTSIIRKAFRIIFYAGGNNTGTSMIKHFQLLTESE
jgi:hypothetical protein